MMVATSGVNHPVLGVGRCEMCIKRVVCISSPLAAGTR